MTDNQDQSLEYIIEPLRHFAIPTDMLNLDPGNARLHSDRNIKAIKASFSKFGQRIPIVVQRQGMVVRAGNGRLEAARDLGWTHIAAIIVDESDLDAVAFGIADNRTAELAEWDQDALAKLLKELEAEVDIEKYLAFSDAEMKKLMAIINEEAAKTITWPELYYLTIEVGSEQIQKQLFDEMTQRGMKCRLSIL